MHDSRRTRVVLGALLLAALALVTVDARGGGAPVSGLRSVGGTIFGGAENLVGAVTRPVSRLFSGSSQAQVTTLQRQIVQLRSELSSARLAQSEEGQLRRLLQLSGRGGYRIVAANVIAASPAYERTVTIDAGAADGIKPNETVLNGTGLVGTVTAVSAHSATVLLVTDAAATVGVRLAGTGQIGAVTGTGHSGANAGLLRLQVFDASAVLHQGEQLVTFGSVRGRPYVPGVPVGVIARLMPSSNSLTKLALVRPYTDDNALGVVGVVIAPPRTNPRDSVLPPSPHPAPTVTVTVTPGGSGAASPPSPGATATPSGASPSAGG